MSLHTLADWSIVAVAFVWSALVVGLVLAKVFTLMNAVAALEKWSGEVIYELVAQEQRLDVDLLRDRMDQVERELTRRDESSEQVA